MISRYSYFDIDAPYQKIKGYFTVPALDQLPRLLRDEFVVDVGLHAAAEQSRCSTLPTLAARFAFPLGGWFSLREQLAIIDRTRSLGEESAR